MPVERRMVTSTHKGKVLSFDWVGVRSKRHKLREAVDFSKKGG